MVNVQECWVNFYYSYFKYDNYFWGRYLLHTNYDRKNTLGDSKPKHYQIYLYTENKVKSHKATISNICVYYKYYKYCYVDTKILICCTWWSSHNCFNGWIYLRWSLKKKLRSPAVHHKTLKFCYLPVAFILLSLEWIAILQVNIDKASNA